MVDFGPWILLMAWMTPCNLLMIDSTQHHGNAAFDPPKKSKVGGRLGRHSRLCC